MRKKNILFCLKYYPVFGGGETVTNILADKLIERDYKVSVSFFKDTSSTLIQSNPSIQQLKLDDKMSLSENILILQQFILDNNIDIIINQWGIDYTDLCWQAKFNSKAKLIVCLHMDPFLKKPFDYKEIFKSPLYILKFLLLKLFPTQVRMIRSRHRHIYQLTDKYVLLSKSYENILSKRLNLNPKDNKLLTIPNPNTYSDNIYPNLNNKTRSIIYVGRLENNHKQLHKMLLAWHHIENKIDEEWTLDIIGDGPDRESLKKMSNNLRMKRIFFHGFVDPTPFYRAASILLLTSAYEGLPMVILEAMQFGVVPIVMNNFTSINDIIENNKTGIIVPKNNIKLFEKAIIESTQMYNNLKMYQKNAIESSIRFSQDYIVDQWEKLFLEL